MRAKISAVAFSLIAFAAFQAARADIFLAVQSGADSTLASDTGQGTPGQVAITGTDFGNYTVNVAFGGTQPVVPSPILGLLSADVTANAPDTIIIALSETGLTFDQAQAFVSILQGTSLVDGGTIVELKTFMDPSNTAFGETNPLTDTGTLLDTSFNSTLLSPIEPGGLFSATEVLFISGNEGETNVSALLADLAVPEPATSTLFLSTLGAIGILRRRAAASR